MLGSSGSCSAVVPPNLDHFSPSILLFSPSSSSFSFLFSLPFVSISIYISVCTFFIFTLTLSLLRSCGCCNSPLFDRWSSAATPHFDPISSFFGSLLQIDRTSSPPRLTGRYSGKPPVAPHEAEIIPASSHSQLVSQVANSRA